MKQAATQFKFLRRWGVSLAAGIACLGLGLARYERVKPASLSTAAASREVLPHPPAPAATRPTPLPTASVATEPPAPELLQLPVSGDIPALVMVGLPDAPPRAFVYLHGLCGDPRKVEPWASQVRPYGTLIAPVGDAGCSGRPGLHYWGTDYRYLDYRIKKSVRSVSEALSMRLDESRIALVGYSQGADRAEDLAWLYPERYTQLILMSGPHVPSYNKLKRTRGVAITRGAREYRRNYRLAGQRLQRAGLPALYRELPGAAHGDFGDEAPQVMAGILSWLAEQPE